MTIVNLPTSRRTHFVIDRDKIMTITHDIEELLIAEPSLKKVKFKKQIPKDIQSNNIIEGIDDDIEEINRIIGRKPVYHLFDGQNKAEDNRVINLYKAYTYIMKKKDINKETLRELYRLISDGLISSEDLKHMGSYYREDAVCITNRPYFDEENQGIDYRQLDYYMNRLFDYINTVEASNYTDSFLISQVIHFFFVYVHPYFDCNGRTSRTLSMWYLLNHNANAFLNFNRSIPFTKGKYNKAIERSRDSSDLTPFIKYMLETEQTQLEKEYIITSIERDINRKFTDEEYILFEFFLSGNHVITLASLTQLFDSVNSHHFTLSEVESKLKPFLSNGILIQVGTTKKMINGDRYNPIYKLNADMFNINSSRVKKLILPNYLNK